MNNDQITNLLENTVSTIIERRDLEQQLRSGRSLRVYLGVDPSSPDIHLGHAVVLWKLRQFQDLGHHVILLIGDFTAQIGDPSGRTTKRTPLTHEIVLQNAQDYQQAASKIIRFDGDNAAELKYNSHWLSKMTLKDIISLSSHFTVQQMIERDMFQDRLKAGRPIGLHEFLYPLIVGIDCIELNVDVEVGGNDQLFNIKAGRTLMEKVNGKRKVVLTCDLLTGSDGTKMSKSAGNAISITTSPDDMFGKLMAIDDKLIEEYARLCADMSNHELENLSKRLKSGENPRDVKMDVAENIVARYNLEEVASKTREDFIITFSKRSNFKGEANVEAFFPAPLVEMPLLELVAVISGQSNTQSRRLIEDGAVDIDEVQAKDPKKMIDLKQSLVIKIGKYRHIRVQHLDGGK